MRNKDIAKGVVIGLALTFLGMSLFTLYFSRAPLWRSFELLYHEKKLGALISLGSLLNLPLFYILLRKKQYNIANGLVGILILLVVVVALLKAF